MKRAIILLAAIAMMFCFGSVSVSYAHLDPNNITDFKGEGNIENADGSIGAHGEVYDDSDGGSWFEDCDSDTWTQMV